MDNTEMTILSDGPYAKLICQFLAQQFPQKLSAKNLPALLDLLTEEILGTKQTRYGPKPPSETVVAMREVLRHYIAQEKPIPFMVPWGSEKPDGSELDIAELYALKQLAWLHQRISAHYAPGAQFNVRLEDVSAPHLFYENAEAARTNAAAYVSSFARLIHVLNLREFIAPIRESRLTDEATFNHEADAILPHMQRALGALQAGSPQATREANSILNMLGWKGGIQDETREFYLAQYAKLYPNAQLEQRLHTLARYFSGALARHRLHIRGGDSPQWEGKFLDLSFVAPVPGTETVFSRRVNYRTMPLEFTSNHLPPWRAKGYLLIGNDNTITPKLTTFSDRKEYVSNVVTIERGAVATVRADYVLE